MTQKNMYVNLSPSDFHTGSQIYDHEDGIDGIEDRGTLKLRKRSTFCEAKKSDKNFQKYVS